ncbi:MAG: hypothetical protein ACT4NY_24860 [Pseudonocardiales bacterium]
MSRDPSAPPIVQQQQLLDDAGKLLHSEVGIDEGSSLQFETSNLIGYAEDMLYVCSADGSRSPAHAPLDLIDIMKDLREAMYQPGSGTWFSATITVSPSGRTSADFNYDDEPTWETGIAPVLYAQDVEKYPRDDAQIPGWLRQRLAEAEATT